MSIDAYDPNETSAISPEWLTSLEDEMEESIEAARAEARLSAEADLYRKVKAAREAEAAASSEADEGGKEEGEGSVVATLVLTDGEGNNYTLEKRESEPEREEPPKVSAVKRAWWTAKEPLFAIAFFVVTAFVFLLVQRLGWVEQIFGMMGV